jgi:hypothetical protein
LRRTQSFGANSVANKNYAMPFCVVRRVSGPIRLLAKNRHLNLFELVM